MVFNHLIFVLILIISNSLFGQNKTEISLEEGSTFENQVLYYENNDKLVSLGKGYVAYVKDFHGMQLQNERAVEIYDRNLKLVKSNFTEFRKHRKNDTYFIDLFVFNEVPYILWSKINDKEKKGYLNLGELSLENFSLKEPKLIREFDYDKKFLPKMIFAKQNVNQSMNTLIIQHYGTTVKMNRKSDENIDIYTNTFDSDLKIIDEKVTQEAYQTVFEKQELTKEFNNLIVNKAIIKNIYATDSKGNSYFIGTNNNSSEVQLTFNEKNSAENKTIDVPIKHSFSSIAIKVDEKNKTVLIAYTDGHKSINILPYNLEKKSFEDANSISFYEDQKFNCISENVPYNREVKEDKKGLGDYYINEIVLNDESVSIVLEYYYLEIQEEFGDNGIPKEVSRSYTYGDIIVANFDRYYYDFIYNSRIYKRQLGLSDRHLSISALNHDNTTVILYNEYKKQIEGENMNAFKKNPRTKDLAMVYCLINKDGDAEFNQLSSKDEMLLSNKVVKDGDSNIIKLFNNFNYKFARIVFK